MAKRIQLTENDLRYIVSNCVRKVIRENELYDEWYEQEDYDGHTGEPGMVKSYDIGTYYIDRAENDAKECGYDEVDDYLKFWFSEIQPECPWYWQKIGSGYGFNGTTIFRLGGIVCKDIYGQIMVDEYHISGPSA